MIKDVVEQSIHDMSKTTSGVNQRTLDAKDIHLTKNGKYQSDKGFIKESQIKALDNYNLLKDAGAELYNDNLDVAKSAGQGALVNIGNGASKGNVSSSNPGYLQVQRPYLIVTLPTLSLPDNYGHYYGYPANYTETLGNLSGFTQVGDVHLDGFSCTKDELDEIEQLLKGGIII